MKYRVLLLAISSSIATAGHADPDQAYNRPPEEALKAFHKFSECEVKLHPRQAEVLVLSAGGDLVRGHPDLFNADCLDEGQLSIPNSDYVRFGFAEELVKREFLKGLPADIGLAAPLAQPPVKESDYQPKPGMNPEALAQLAKERKEAAALNALSIYGECVARANAADALRLVLSDPESSEEAQAFSSISSALSSCLMQGQKVELGKAMLRGSLALNLYRLAKAPRVPLKPLFSYEDYPAEAIRNHWEGTVIAEGTVNAEGTPTSCHIVKSSGHQILDDTTCNIMMQRARFKPEGKENTFTTPPINWHIR